MNTTTFNLLPISKTAENWKALTPKQNQRLNDLLFYAVIGSLILAIGIVMGSYLQATSQAFLSELLSPKGLLFISIVGEVFVFGVSAYTLAAKHGASVDTWILKRNKYAQEEGFKDLKNLSLSKFYSNYYIWPISLGIIPFVRVGLLSEKEGDSIVEIFKSKKKQEKKLEKYSWSTEAVDRKKRQMAIGALSKLDQKWKSMQEFLAAEVLDLTGCDFDDLSFSEDEEIESINL